DREREGRTCPKRTLHPDPPAMEFHELPTQGEPQARALDLLRSGPHLAKLFEDLLLVLGGNTNPGISDRNLHQSILGHGAHINPSTLRCELDRIREEVQYDLPDLPFIGLNLVQPFIDV